MKEIRQKEIIDKVLLKFILNTSSLNLNHLKEEA